MNEVSAILNFVAHESGEHFVCLRVILSAHLQKGTTLWFHRR